MNAKFEIQAIEQNAIAAAFANQGGTKNLFERIKSEACSLVFDMENKDDRDALKSFAYGLARTKTTVDNYGKELVSGIKAQAAVIDADRKFWRDSMEALQEEIRAPLTAFENAKKERIAKFEGDIEEIKRIGLSAANYDAASLKAAIADLESKPLESFEEYEEQAKLAKFETLETLRTTLAAREKYEAEQAELERLRIAEQQRLQREHEEKIAQQAAENARAEAERKAQAEREQAERAAKEAEQREARLKAEKEAAELRATQAAETERKRIEAEQFAKDEAERKAEEARLANVEYMRSINSEAVKALCFAVPGLTEDMAKDVVRAIAKNAVPNVAIKY